MSGTEIMALALIAPGALLALVGAIGLVRLEERQLRLRALWLAALPGGALLLGGLAVSAWDLAVSARLGVLISILAGVGAAAQFALANSAHAEPDDRA